MPLAKPPMHLSAATKRFWREVVSTYELEVQHLRVLEAACTAWDRCEQARQQVEQDGITIKDRFGTVRVNPAVKVEHDARTQFLRAVRELDLDVEPASEIPRVAGRR